MVLDMCVLLVLLWQLYSLSEWFCLALPAPSSASLVGLPRARATLQKQFSASFPAAEKAVQFLQMSSANKPE